MKRDMELVRQIALAIEDHEHGWAHDAPLRFEGFTEEQVGYHVLIMGEAGLLQVQDTTSMGDASPNGIPSRLTWAGHEFVAAVRSDTIWNKTKAIVGKAGSATLGVWIEIASKLLLQTVDG